MDKIQNCDIIQCYINFNLFKINILNEIIVYIFLLNEK